MEIRPGFPLAVGITDTNTRDPLTGLRLLVIIENPNPEQPDQPMNGGVRVIVPLDDTQVAALHKATSPVEIVTADDPRAGMNREQRRKLERLH